MGQLPKGLAPRASGFANASARRDAVCWRVAAGVRTVLLPRGLRTLPCHPANFLIGVPGPQGRRLPGIISPAGLLSGRFVRKSGRPADRKQRRLTCAQGETRLGAIIRRVNPEVMVTVVRSIRANVQRAKWQGAHLELLYPGRWKTHRVAFERALRPVLRNLRRLDRMTSCVRGTHASKTAKRGAASVAMQGGASLRSSESDGGFVLGGVEETQGFSTSQSPRLGRDSASLEMTKQRAESIFDNLAGGKRPALRGMRRGGARRSVCEIDGIHKERIFGWLISGRHGGMCGCEVGEGRG